MIQRIEQWLIGLFRKELAAATAEIAALRAELAAMHAEMKEHTLIAAKSVQTHAESVAAGIKSHAKEAADELHAKITEDAKTIVKFQQTARLGCSWCGQLSRTYILTGGKIKCADCQKKGAE